MDYLAIGHLHVRAKVTLLVFGYFDVLMSQLGQSTVG